MAKQNSDDDDNYPPPSAPYYGPFAPGVTPGPGEGDRAHNPHYDEMGGGPNAAANEAAIRDQYAKSIGRQPTAQELADDLDAARRYGLTNPNGPTNGALGRIAARGNNSPGSGIPGNPYGQGATSSPVSSNGTPNQSYSGYVDRYASERERIPPYTGYNYQFNTPQAYQAPTLAGYTPTDYSAISGVPMQPSNGVPVGTPFQHGGTFNPGDAGGGRAGGNLRPDGNGHWVDISGGGGGVAASAGGGGGGLQQLIQNLVNNPHSLNPDVIAAMKEAQKDEAVGMYGQLSGGIRHDANMRGINYAPLQARADADLAGNLTGAYRNIDITAANQNRQDELNAANAATTFLDHATQRDTTNFGVQHQTALDQESLRQAQADSLFRNEQLSLAQQQSGAADSLAQWQSRAAGTTEWNSGAYNLAQLSAQSLAQQLAQNQFLESIRQFNAGQNNQFALAQFLANQYHVG